MVAIAFYSITGQTERFIKKTQLSAHQIDDANPKYDMGKSYILIVPSYQDFMMDSVVDFLTYKDNKKILYGLSVVATETLTTSLLKLPKRSRQH